MPRTTGSQPQQPDDTSPLAGYAVFRRAGDVLYLSGLVPVDLDRGTVITGYDDLPEDERTAAGATGMISIDRKEGPVAAQSWWLFTELRAIVEGLGGSLGDVVHLAQYLTDLAEFPIYSRIREQFFDRMPASTVVGVSELMPEPSVRVEIQAVVHLPEEVSSLGRQPRR